MRNNIKEFIQLEHENTQKKIEQAKSSFESYKNAMINGVRNEIEIILNKISKKDQKITAKYLKHKQKLAVKSMAVTAMQDDIDEVEKLEFNL